MLYVRHIPNTITSLNLLSGSLSVMAAMNGNLTGAALWIVLAAVFDFADGLAARLLGAYSEIGKELDSLADVISFGLAPSVILFQMCQHAWVLNGYTNFSTFSTGWWLCLPALLPAIFAALRLAKFNLDKRQTSGFLGLPTPAFALFVCALPFSAQAALFYSAWLSEPMVLWGIVALFGYLMVSEHPMFALKFKWYGWKGNEIRYLFAGCSGIILACLSFKGLAWVILLYIVISIIAGLGDSFREKNK